MLCCSVVVLSRVPLSGQLAAFQGNIIFKIICSMVKEQQILAYCHLNSKVQLFLRCSLGTPSCQSPAVPVGATLGSGVPRACVL